MSIPSNGGKCNFYKTIKVIIFESIHPKNTLDNWKVVPQKPIKDHGNWIDISVMSWAYAS